MHSSWNLVPFPKQEKFPTGKHRSGGCEVLEPGPSREEGTSWEGAAHWCWQGVRAEPAVLAGVFVPNLLTLPSCCTNVFVHWECGGKRGVFDASKVDNKSKNSADQGILSKMAITVLDKPCILISEVEWCCPYFCPPSSAVGQLLHRVL